MKVMANKTGFYGGVLRREGDVFEAGDAAKSSWFSPVDKATPAKHEKPKAKDTSTFSEVAKRDAATIA